MATIVSSLAVYVPVTWSSDAGSSGLNSSKVSEPSARKTYWSRTVASSRSRCQVPTRSAAGRAGFTSRQQRGAGGDPQESLVHAGLHEQRNSKLCAANVRRASAASWRQTDHRQRVTSADLQRRLSGIQHTGVDDATDEQDRARSRVSDQVEERMIGVEDHRLWSRDVRDLLVQARRRVTAAASVPASFVSMKAFCRTWAMNNRWRPGSLASASASAMPRKSA